MTAVNEELQRRLLFIVHRGLVEARLLAQARNCAQIFDLTDALEPIPGYMTDWEDSHLESIRFNLKKYRDAYPSASFDYLRYLEVDPLPQRF
jgi:hypothetical protein